MNAVLTTCTHAETVELGRRLGGLLGAGMVIALAGDLGAGKTTLIKGIAQGLLQLDEREVTSPTFTILQEYPGAVPLYHFDAYRLGSVDDLEAVGFDDYIESDGVAVIEWADRITAALPETTLWIYIEIVDDGLRRYRFETGAQRYETLFERLVADYPSAG